MLILDLQWLLFGLLCGAALLAGALIILGDRRAVRGGHAPAAMAGGLQGFERAPIGLLLLQDLTIRYANHSAVQMLHLASPAQDGSPAVPESPLPEADWRDLLQADRVAARQALHAAAAESGVSAPPGRYRNLTFASGRTVRWWVSPQGALDMVLLLDISAQQRARHVGRSLLSDLGHELRTPIATLLTHLEILGFEDLGEEVRRQSLTLSRREAQRMSRLIEDMLELGRLEMTEALTHRPLNLLTLVEETIAQTAPRAHEAGIAVEVVSAAGLPLVWADEDRLRQVLLNLLDNAYKYAGSGARVTVSLERVPTPGSGGLPSTEGSRPAEGVRCAVCDTGRGISPEHLPYLTQRFYRAAPDTVDGSGLGLSLVQEILQRHESTLEIASPALGGRGACFSFVLPQPGQGEEREP